MPTTLSNGVVVPTTGDLVDPVALLGAMATGFSNALGGLGAGVRQPLLFKVATQGDKTTLASQITLMNGDQAFLEDTKWFEQYNGSAWKVIKTTVPIAFAFASGYITVSTGTSNCTYSIDGDLVTVRGSFTFVSSSSFPTNVGGLGMTLPFPAANVTSGTAMVTLGTIVFRRGSTGSVWTGPVILNGSSVLAAASNLYVDARVDTAAVGGALSIPGGTVPFGSGWVAGDSLSFEFRYRKQ